jgi:hypothetical protein
MQGSGNCAKSAAAAYNQVPGVQNAVNSAVAANPNILNQINAGGTVSTGQLDGLIKSQSIQVQSELRNIASDPESMFYDPKPANRDPASSSSPPKLAPASVNDQQTVETRGEPTGETGGGGVTRTTQ